MKRRPRPPRTRETGGPSGELILYQTEDGQSRIECRFETETVWLTQALMARLFQTSVQNVNLHVQNVLEEAEVSEATIKDYLMVRAERGRDVRRRIKHYKLEMILAVGRRVRSERGNQFRQWATARLSEYLVKGFVLDDEARARIRHDELDPAVDADSAKRPVGVSFLQRISAVVDHGLRWTPEQRLVPPGDAPAHRCPAVATSALVQTARASVASWSRIRCRGASGRRLARAPGKPGAECAARTARRWRYQRGVSARAGAAAIRSRASPAARASPDRTGPTGRRRESGRLSTPFGRPEITHWRPPPQIEGGDAVSRYQRVIAGAPA